MSSTNTAVVWFRNDLRTLDHQALFEASTQYEQVMGVFVLDERAINGKTQHFEFPKIGDARLQFLLEALSDLRTQLRALGSELYVLRGKTEDSLPDFVRKVHAQAVFTHEEITDEEIEIDILVEQKLDQQGVGLYMFWGSTLYHPDDIPFSQTEIPKVFTPFRKKVEKLATVRKTYPLPRIKTRIEEKDYDPTPIPSMKNLGRERFQVDDRAAIDFKGGQTGALARLEHYFFISRNLEVYKQTRNGLLGYDYSSKFSPSLALGCISPRTIFHEIKRYEKEFIANDSTYWLIFELIWRDFFRFVFWRYENKLFQLRGLLKDSYPNPSNFVDEARLEEWRTGQTGIPFVDANMRELLHTGFMSNRGRQNVASYLVHFLNCDWRWGAEWFESQLVDYDPCSNYGNWAYISGVGNDPRTRYFNVLKQANDYDSKGSYVQHWIPVLSAFGKDIHTPFRLNKDQWTLAGIVPNQDYPYAQQDPENIYRRINQSK